MLKHAYYTDVHVGSNLGGFYIDENGYIKNISKELEEMLLRLPYYSIVEELKEEEVVGELVIDCPDLEAMTVKELREFAKEKGVKLTATKKSEIVKEILAEM